MKLGKKKKAASRRKQFVKMTIRIKAENTSDMESTLDEIKRIVKIHSEISKVNIEVDI